MDEKIKDIPFCNQVSWRVSDYISLNEDVWIWFATDNAVAPNTVKSILLYTVPVGFRAIVGDVSVSASFTGEVSCCIELGDNIVHQHFSANIAQSHSFTMSSVALPGQQIGYTLWNNDINTGNFRFMFSMWLAAGSIPELPKNDNPYERFKVGNFRTINQINLSDKETIYIFHNKQDFQKARNALLWIKNYKKSNQEIIKQFYINNEQTKEINISRDNEQIKKLINNLK